MPDGHWENSFYHEDVNGGQERLCDLQGWRCCLDKALSNLIQVSPTVSKGLDQISSRVLFQPKLDSAIQSNVMKCIFIGESSICIEMQYKIWHFGMKLFGGLCVFHLQQNQITH